MSIDKKADDLDLPTGDHVEEIDQIKLDNQLDQSELSGIENTAASKAAWLISIVVSIGGLLFGMIITMLKSVHANLYPGYDTGYISAVECVTFGQLLASALGAGFAQVKGEGWRATVGVGAAPAIILAGLLFTCPESPRQLVFHGHLEQADAVLRRIYPKYTVIQREAKIRSIQLSLNESTQDMAGESVLVAFKRIFTTPATGRAVLTACMIMAISQLGGFNTLMYYAATLFSIVGFDNPTAVGITVSGTNFVFSVVNLALVDRFGRRIIMLFTILGMAICMAVAVAAFRYIPVNTDTLVVESKQIGWPGVLVLVAIICYVACYSSGVATIAWIGTELIPLEVRAVGTMMNTVTCWSTNIIISSTFLSMMKSWTPSGAFAFYMGICFFGWLFVVFFFPECKGMPLEAIRKVFSDGFGVRYSKKWQKEHKHDAKVHTVVLGH
ncbi:hypothetical protein N7492_004722 [Penicillium capsulatum]|uniref:Major facilitator superfamily (MFS) profile domain-containing protein n=1 Tax=Penicillium capsulatum TaxID=69766 RepID=A0A9W9IAF1_9EURO|nr:hypothetical protein N7492_004722 [Penicillium capsulatum]KAJ6136173.1 hypothetical protein N7512_001333 [Penicillium capsulatum]